MCFAGACFEVHGLRKHRLLHQVWASKVCHLCCLVRIERTAHRLCLTMFGKELNLRLAREAETSHIVVHTLHPGAVYVGRRAFASSKLKLPTDPYLHLALLVPRYTSHAARLHPLSLHPLDCTRRQVAHKGRFVERRRSRDGWREVLEPGACLCKLERRAQLKRSQAWEVRPRPEVVDPNARRILWDRAVRECGLPEDAL